jgi:hypothetical protein
MSGTILFLFVYNNSIKANPQEKFYSNYETNVIKGKISLNRKRRIAYLAAYLMVKVVLPEDHSLGTLTRGFQLVRYRLNAMNQEKI